MAGSTARYDLLFETAPDAIVLFDHNEHVIAANGVARQWWQGVLGQLIGWYHQELYAIGQDTGQETPKETDQTAGNKEGTANLTSTSRGRTVWLVVRRKYALLLTLPCRYQ